MEEMVLGTACRCAAGSQCTSHGTLYMVLCVHVLEPTRAVRSMLARLGAPCVGVADTAEKVKPTPSAAR